MYIVISTVVIIFVFLYLIMLVIKVAVEKHERKMKGEPPERESTVQEDLIRGLPGEVPKADTISDEGKNFLEKFYSGKTPQGKRGRYIAGEENRRIKEMVEKNIDE